ncbi:ferrous iron transport protein B [Candidatus Bipolaricaulota bacterium]|nr:ferrous iron transport protein B [Candidatus Bipolaricaulota bacterium]
MRIALVGQPNCGKSTLFNHLVGYKANTSNLPGTTVEFLSSHTLIAGQSVELVDLPGTYSLTSFDEAEAETRRYLLDGHVDAVLNVVDASLLSRSLELTLQLLEMGLPLAVCLNMEDEASRKGILVDSDRLAEMLGVSVVSAVAVRGRGVVEAARAVVNAARARQIAPFPRYGDDVESTLARIEAQIPPQAQRACAVPARLVAIKLLEEDAEISRRVHEVSPECRRLIQPAQEELAKARGRLGEDVLAAERHARAMELYEATTTVGSPQIGLRDRLDAVLMHRILGIPLFAAIMYGFFVAVFKLGSLIEAPVIGWFDRWTELLAGALGEGTIGFALTSGMIQGVGGAVGIVLPYLLPFLIGLAILEDIGYLPRAGYLMDGFMHKIGLHGKSVIPFILGYGCSVPAVMATRILDSKRDRFITAMLSVMIPCVARSTVIFGLVGYFLGPHLAFALFVINIFVIALLGKILTKVFPRVTPGLILEIPTYKVPSTRVVFSKVRLRVEEFLVIALPVLVIGSIVLSVLEFTGVDRYLNLALLPITWSLGLPAVVGVTLVFGVFRKELSLVMLFQALGTSQVDTVMSAGQIMVFTVFVLFYIPCVATIAALDRELGRTRTAAVVGVTVGTALVVGLITRGLAALLA